MEHLQILRRGVPKRQNDVILADIFTLGVWGTGSITCAQSQPLARSAVAVYFAAQWKPSYWSSQPRAAVHARTHIKTRRSGKKSGLRDSTQGRSSLHLFPDQ